MMSCENNYPRRLQGNGQFAERLLPFFVIILQKRAYKFKWGTTITLGTAGYFLNDIFQNGELENHIGRNIVEQLQ